MNPRSRSARRFFSVLSFVIPIAVIAAASKDTESAAPSPALLKQNAQQAASKLRERQSSAGYWLTAFTESTRFESPQMEMNTFLTAMMIDFLSPIAREYDLEKAVQRAREHLGAQIEDDGLVRFHGRPDGPTIGPLGVVITPDSDDTALAWRISGPRGADPRKDRMLENLSQYRDARGLYRTWLAPVERYQNIDPGNDPDPVDATIQMHVYLMLRELDPAVASTFCDALKKAVDQEDVWVYYAKAPLVPFLRSAELRQKGCNLGISSDLLRRAAEGQEIWSDLARRLVSAMSQRPSADDRRTGIELLTRIAGDDFSAIRRAPPLLYHNDLTGHVSRYYWSEDFGYVLWLRLYDATAADKSSIKARR